ncbi:MAG: 50S ribosomal protein L18 [Candidatus Methanomethylicota archaeon]|uniref:Large ribosomal subunit protein uL18 n=1 Tax=Thermoproteota archaeon TaxID=2056631 RepID=A0A497EQW5_9CREN|nr:MAG: 50S ribosomal protein L18 [Candidatus Verstraetearchaeota archaeon]RLE52535.1 MAG: 50S ribosomal protein L18 [Candidatus Verstraetearchaeota archaeon]
MARGPMYKVPFRRRREGKTDYRLRRKLILSGLPRLVVRGSLKHFIVQVAKAEIEGDKVLASAHTKQLVRDFGWKGACGNVPAAYLVGLLAGLRAVSKGIKKAVLDIGLATPTKGSRVFAALKGALDAGMEIPHGEEMLPDEDRILGRHIADYAHKLMEYNIEEYNRRFSRYLSNNLPPEKLPEHVEEVKNKILAAFEGGDEGGGQQS